ncbi:exodeoxyribonuclease V subunit alpha [Marinobacteraceae bacterium S3BR75-40.1]
MGFELDTTTVIDQIGDWQTCDWLRALDRALVEFLQDRQPDAAPLTLLSAALVSHQLGRGHSCLLLEQALAAPDDTLSLPPDGDRSDNPVRRPSQVLAGLTLDDWLATLKQDPLVGRAGSKREGNGEDATPLVLDGQRLYLRRYWRSEQAVAAGIRQRLQTRIATPDDLQERLDSLFGPLRDEAETARTEPHWQTVAAAIAARSAFTVVSGGPGTGKTTTVVRLLGLLQSIALEPQGEHEQGQPLRIHLAAPTGKAAARLTESIGNAIGQLPPEIQPHIPADVTTVHRLLRPLPGSRRFRHNADNPLHLDLLVVDEASMVDLELMAALLDALPPQARLILLGDKDQLASVEAGAILGELCRDAEQPGYSAQLVDDLREQTGYDLSAYQGDRGPLADHIALLRKSHRFGQHSGIGQLARAINEQNITDTQRLLADPNLTDLALIRPKTTQGLPPELLAQLVRDGGGGFFGEHPEGKQPQGYRKYLELVKRGPQGGQSTDDWARHVLEAFGEFQVLCALRAGPFGVDGLNEAIEQHLRDCGLIERTQGWYAGRPVLMTRNDYGLGLMNGDVGIALPDPESDGRLRVFFPLADGTLKRVLPHRLSDVMTTFAMTVHKSQGSEFGHACLVLPDLVSPVLTKELLYTGVTRAKSWLSLVVPRGRVLELGVERRVLRASGLGEQLARED